jgi:hypothetical protein
MNQGTLDVLGLQIRGDDDTTGLQTRVYVADFQILVQSGTL